VIAHEVGHHVQNLLGILPRAQQAQRAADSKAAANHIQVQVELQADCLAGVWANRENEMLKSQGKPPFIEPGDVEAALRTAAAIGDDTLQRRARLRGSGLLHARHLGAAPTLVRYRLPLRLGRKLQHLCLRAALEDEGSVGWAKASWLARTRGQ